MSVKTEIDPERVARIASFVLHAKHLPEGGGDEELIAVGRYVQTKIPLQPREFFCALLHVAKVAREIVRQDKLEATLATPAPAPKPRRTRKPRRDEAQQDLFQRGKKRNAAC
jgi:hypothetical protein